MDSFRHIHVVGIAFFFVLVFLGTAPLEGASREARLKARYIENFAKFVRWPERARGDEAAKMIIAAIGDQDVYQALTGLDGSTIQGRVIAVRHFRNMSDLDDCDMLFIGKRAWTSLPFLLTQYSDAAVVTVSDHWQFAQKGGMIQLQTKRNGLGFIINQATATDAGIHISSQLLKLAESVITQDKSRRYRGRQHTNEIEGS